MSRASRARASARASFDIRIWNPVVLWNSLEASILPSETEEAEDVMSTVAAKRERRKKLKPKLSFGSSSGASGNLPSNMQANLPELFALLKTQLELCRQQAQDDEPPCEVNGNVTGWSAHKRSLNNELLMYSGPVPNVPNCARSSPDSTTASDGKEFELDILGTGENGTTSICVEEVIVDEELEPEPLTEADVTDIVRQLREVLQEKGPSQEDDLLNALAPEQARRVLATYDTLTAFLYRHPGFRLVHEDLHSFIYYQDPDDDDDDDCYYSTTAAVYNGVPALNAGAEHQLHSLVAGNNGPRSVRTSSCSSTSYESAMEEEEDYEDGKGKKHGLKDGSSQTPSRPRCQSRALQAVQPTCDAESQTQGWDPAEFAELELMLRKRNTEISQLQERLASMQEAHALEMQQLHLKIEELQSGPQVPPTPPPQNEVNQEMRSSCSTSDEEEDERPQVVATINGDMNGEAEEEEEGHGWLQARSPAVLRSPLPRSEPDEKLHALSIEPRPKPEPPVEQKVKRQERPQVPEFYDLHWRMEQAAAPCSDVESMWSSRGGSPTKSKTEMQITKIVHMVKKKQPNYSEQEIRKHVDYMRKSQGGFSRMTFNSIVALVLGHMKSNAE